MLALPPTLALRLTPPLNLTPDRIPSPIHHPVANPIRVESSAAPPDRRLAMRMLDDAQNGRKKTLCSSSCVGLRSSRTDRTTDDYFCLRTAPGAHFRLSPPEGTPMTGFRHPPLALCARLGKLFYLDEND
ncbi:unnamed protein product [Lampetra planeri]